MFRLGILFTDCGIVNHPKVTGLQQPSPVLYMNLNSGQGFMGTAHLCASSVRQGGKIRAAVATCKVAPPSGELVLAMSSYVGSPTGGLGFPITW